MILSLNLEGVNGSLPIGRCREQVPRSSFMPPEKVERFYFVT